VSGDEREHDQVGVGEVVPRKLRSGGQALLILSDPINLAILRTLTGGKRTSGELAALLENISRTTRFERLREFEGLGLIRREKQAGMPPLTFCQLDDAGAELLLVAVALGRWLRRSSLRGPLALGDVRAAPAVKALALGWGSPLRRLAEGPYSLTELEQLIEEMGYRELERLLRNLVDVGLAERVSDRGRLRRYSATAWARQSVAPLAAAARWERAHLPERSTPISGADAEAALLMALPLLQLPATHNGACAILVETDAAESEPYGGVAVEFVQGRPAWCAPMTARARRESRAWIRGSLGAWVDATAADSPDLLQAGGDRGFAEALIRSLHVALARPAPPVASS
jgi:DNA-binding HxlR family transcriptional regulator